MADILLNNSQAGAAVFNRRVAKSITMSMAD
jgi:hypothetical protein